MIGAWLQSLMGRPPTAARGKLVIVAFNLANQWSHHYNELLGYKEAARSLGLVPHILVPRSAEPALAAALSAAPVIEPPPAMVNVTIDNLVDHLLAFADAKRHLASLWAAVETHDLRSDDFLFFPVPHPAVVASVGEWLARRAPERHPSVFFRFTGGEVSQRTSGRIDYAAILFRLACSELGQLPGHERVFLLADNSPTARVLTRFCCRRAFLMTLPKYLGSTASDDAVTTDPYSIHVHFNSRSGRLIGELSNVIRLVAAAHPAIRFTIKTSGLVAEKRALIESQCASLAHVLPDEQDAGDYLANFSKCAVVVLAYEAQPYTAGSSGVFIEAASFGKVAGVPAGTWMSEQIADGCGAGTTFAEPGAESLAAALLQAIADFPRLSTLARERAPEVRSRNSSARYIEQIMSLVRQMPDMEPVCHLDEEINFGDTFDSRYFMREGWGETEDWGVWTIGRHAVLCIGFASPQAVVLRALVQPFLTKTHRRIEVRVSAGPRQVARWTFSLDSDAGDRPQWREALIRPISRCTTLTISFAIDAPTSPFAEGISGDKRTLGLGLRKLIFRSFH
jgi:glycosyltransferase involved in cell wall biosynthesis